MYKQNEPIRKKKIPFLFIIDYEINKPLIIPAGEALKNNILFSLGKTKNYKPKHYKIPEFSLTKNPLNYLQYKKSFDLVMEHLRYGNSFLTNLTFPTEISTTLSFEEIYHLSKAPFRLLVKKEFVVFSPESFVKIKGRKISSHPMKGTIDASVPQARAILLNDPKETAEHHTIVDLVRNDLSMVADNVKVEKFRYIDKITTAGKSLLQVSSEISGILPENYNEKIGSILFSLLPAGSISGAPKRKTVEIIREAESCPRGYYTGIFGIYDGYNLDSAVMIRYIERVNEKLIYRSGGGITVYSDPEKEYRELIDKIYLPIF